MGVKERPVDIGSTRARRIVIELGHESRNARMFSMASARRKSALVKEYGEALQPEFPMPWALIRAALAQGHDPGGSGFIMM
jgi:hypothetical protein